MGSKLVRFARNAIPRKTMAKTPVSLSDIRAARRRIRSGVIVTPCPESIPLSEITGARIVCKLDNFQRTGSFKERGARNALLRLPGAKRAKGVVSASAGNHALGLAYHGKLLGIPVTVVMPEFAPLIKITTRRKSTSAESSSDWPMAKRPSRRCTMNTAPARMGICASAARRVQNPLVRRAPPIKCAMIT